MDEDDPITVGRDQCPHDIHDGPAHPAGTVSRRREDDHLGLALRDRVGDAMLVQSRIRRLTRIDRPQIVDVTGHEIATSRGRHPDRWGAGIREGLDRQSRGVDGIVTLPREDLDAPGAGTREAHVSDEDALYVGLAAVDVARTVGVNVHVLALLDDLQLVVEGWRFRREARRLVAEIVDPYGDARGVDECAALHESERESILADHQLRGRDQDLQRFGRQGSGLARRRPVTVGRAHRDEQPQRDHTRDDGPTPADPPAPRPTPQ